MYCLRARFVPHGSLTSRLSEIHDSTNSTAKGHDSYERKLKHRVQWVRQGGLPRPFLVEHVCAVAYTNYYNYSPRFLERRQHGRFGCRYDNARDQPESVVDGFSERTNLSATSKHAVHLYKPFILLTLQFSTLTSILLLSATIVSFISLYLSQ